MTTSARPRTSATVLRYVLVVLLLALAGLLAVPGADPTAAAASGVVAAGQHVTDPVADRVVATAGQHTDHGTPHGAEALGLLCLCALLVTGIVLAGRGVTTYRVALRAVATVRGRWLGTRSYPHIAGPDPVFLGISRT
ncbi:hypothetical protein [Promicromonospora sp. NPDC057488]|uniref:hypothetical protein n=1 Tax=Promicromonospora sp. NPDC057488 TaxID=3346147 RepID=UPI00366E13E5